MRAVLSSSWQSLLPHPESLNRDPQQGEQATIHRSGPSFACTLEETTVDITRKPSIARLKTVRSTVVAKTSVKRQSAASAGHTYPVNKRPGGGQEILDDDLLNLEAHEHAAKISDKEIQKLHAERGRFTDEVEKLLGNETNALPLEIHADGKSKPVRKLQIDYQPAIAFARPSPKWPQGIVDLGGLPIRTRSPGQLPVLPDIQRLKRFPILPWRPSLWPIWEGLIPLLRCLAVPAKNRRAEIPIAGEPAMVKVSRDCSRAYVVNKQGQGTVVNVITETVDATFQVAPHPNPARPYPPGLGPNPVVSPFIKGGINHKYRRLYVPASFYLGDGTGGFFVAVVDVNPGSPNYLQTIAWIDCGWLPEQVSFTANGETGVIANYMEGTATIFRVSDHTPLNEVPLFPGAGVDQLNPALPGSAGTFARSVVVANVPGRGNLALATLTNSTGFPGFAAVELDTAGNPVQNITRSDMGFIDGIAVTPGRDRVLLVDASNFRLHVYRIQGENFVFEKSIALPSGGAGRVYMGGIALHPTTTLAFLGTGRNPGSGINALTCVNYQTDVVMDLPDNIANGTWDLVIKSFGLPIKPHIFVVSTSGRLTIIPC